MPHRINPDLARRLLAIAVAPVVIAAGVILYGYPTRTAELFAWPISPTMTPLVMGAGYLAAAWFFFRLWLSRDWASVAPVLSGVLAFTSVMLAATLLHWSRFSHDKFTFWLWLVVYVISPPAVALVIALHRGHRDAPDTGPRVHPALRAAFGWVFAALLLLALAMVFAPASVIDAWPWRLTPLTSRVLGGWVAVLAIGGLQMCRSLAWRGWAVGLETGAIWFALIAAALPGARADFTSESGHAVFRGALLALLAAFMGVWGWHRARARAA